MESTSNDTDLEALNDRLSRCVDRQSRSLVAAQYLFDQGETPTIVTVRALTQMGSNTDIGKDLKVFWASLRRTARLPDLPDELAEAMTSIWAQAVGLADQRFERDRARTRKEVEDLQERMDRLQAALTSAQQAYAGLAEVHQELEAAAAQSKEQIAALTATVDAEKQAIARMSAEREALLKQHAVQQEAAEQRLMTAVKEAELLRERDLEVMEAERHYTRQQIDEARQQTKAAEKQLAEMTANRDKLAKQHQDVLIELERTKVELKNARQAKPAVAPLEKKNMRKLVRKR